MICNATEPEALRVCLTVMQGTWDNVTRVAQAAEASGLHGFGVADTPLVERDLYIACAAAANCTKRLDIVTGVTNPVTRHPSVAAAALLQLHELAPGRLVCGIATGDSALWGVGLKPARIATLRDYILALKAMLRGESATWRGQSFAPQWKRFDPFDLKVYVACAGPKSIRMAAQVADGLILSVGVSPEDIAWAQRQIAEACGEIGRDPKEIDLWHYTEIIFAASAAAAAERSLGAFSHWLTLGGTAGKRIPPEHLAGLTALNADRQNIEATYGKEDQGPALVRRAKALGLYDWLVSRSPCLWGTPAEVRHRMEALRARGVSRWMLYPGAGIQDDAQVANLLGEALRIGGKG